MKIKHLTLAAGMLAAAVLIASIATADLSPGAKAPNFTLPTLNGKTFSLQNALKPPTKVVVLDIWATWCPPCRAEVPYLVNLNKKFAGKGVQFVGVAIDSEKSPVSSFAKDKGIGYTVALDPNAKTVGNLYQVRGIPATYIIDRKGVIRYAHSGFSGQSEAAEIDKEIQTLLAGK